MKNSLLLKRVFCWVFYVFMISNVIEMVDLLPSTSI